MRFETFNTPEKHSVIEKCREDKNRHWDGLMEQYGSYIRSLSFHYGNKYGIGEDIEQESLLKIHSKFEAYRGATPREFKAWFGAVIHNTAMSYMERHKRLIAVDDETLAGASQSSTNPEEMVMLKLKLEAAVAATHDMSDLEKNIFAGMLGDRTPDEEAERLGMTRCNYESRKSKLRGKIKKALAEI